MGGITGYYPPNPAGELVAPVSINPHFLLIPISTALGGLIAGLLVYGLAPEAEGHGTDAAIDAFHNKGGVIRRRVPIIKTIASAFTIGTGGSAGREGPTAQIAARLRFYSWRCLQTLSQGQENRGRCGNWGGDRRDFQVSLRGCDS